MINLDDTQKIMSSQGGDVVIKSIQSFLEQIKVSYTDSGRMEFPNDYKNVNNVCFCGMGGSRFPGLIVSNLYKDLLTTPVTICDDYVLPGFVNDKTLVVLSSYSGTTEEVLHLAKEAKSRGAKIAGYCVGDGLETWLKDEGLPAYIFEPSLNPSGQPRIGFGYTIGASISIFAKLGLIKGETHDSLKTTIINECLNLTPFNNSFGFDSPETKNPAKKIAHALYEKYPYFVVAEHLVGVGNAVQNQINETSKNISSFRVIPELNHHLMEGLAHPESHKSMAIFIMITSSLYNKRVSKRFVVTEDVVKQNGISVLAYQTRGLSKIADVFEVAMLGSYISMYLGALYGVDPAKIPYVDYFKEQMKR